MSEDAFAIIVKFTLKPGKAAAFRPLIIDNAVSSSRDESTGQQFQVLQDELNPEVIYLYEAYDNAAALDSHRDTPHFRRFIDSANDMIATREIQRCAVIPSRS